MRGTAADCHPETREPLTAQPVSTLSSTIWLLYISVPAVIHPPSSPHPSMGICVNCTMSSKRTYIVSFCQRVLIKLILADNIRVNCYPVFPKLTDSHYRHGVLTGQQKGAIWCLAGRPQRLWEKWEINKTRTHQQRTERRCRAPESSWVGWYVSVRLSYEQKRDPSFNIRTLIIVAISSLI